MTTIIRFVFGRPFHAPVTPGLLLSPGQAAGPGNREAGRRGTESCR
jgi:hypothetical protein